MVNEHCQVAFIMASIHKARERIFPVLQYAIIAPLLMWQCESIIIADCSEFTIIRNARSCETITLNDLDKFWASQINKFDSWFTGLIPKMSAWGPSLCTPHSSPAMETASSTVTLIPSWSNRSSWSWFPLIIASLSDFFQDSGRMLPEGHAKLFWKNSLLIYRAMNTQALLLVLPWISDWDSLKLHSVTPVKFEELDALIHGWGGTPGWTGWSETAVGTGTARSE